MIRSPVKVALQRSQRISRQINQGRLAGRYLMAGKVIAYRDRQNDRGNRDEQRNFYNSHRITPSSPSRGGSQGSSPRPVETKLPPELSSRKIEARPYSAGCGADTPLWIYTVARIRYPVVRLMTRVATAGAAPARRPNQPSGRGWDTQWKTAGEGRERADHSGQRRDLFRMFHDSSNFEGSAKSAARIARLIIARDGTPCRFPSSMYVRHESPR
jgi:hypothetical protein